MCIRRLNQATSEVVDRRAQKYWVAFLAPRDSRRVRSACTVGSPTPLGAIVGEDGMFVVHHREDASCLVVRMNRLAPPPPSWLTGHCRQMSTADIHQFCAVPPIDYRAPNELFAAKSAVFFLPFPG